MKAFFSHKSIINSSIRAMGFLVMALSLQAIAATQYEAENATLSGGANKNTNHTGYSGTGFVDGFFNSATAQVSFAITGATAGSSTITLRYSAGNGASSNTGLYVNGTKIKNISCPATTNWDTWSSEVETITLNAGNNTIAYKTETSSGSSINIDYISVNSSDPCTGVQGGGAGLKGAVFGLNPPWSAGAEYCKATDGDINTSYDCSQANGGYAGLDFGSAKVIGKIRYYPRSTFASRMTGGKFQGSNDGSSYTDLYAISATPAVQWNEVTISNSAGYRFVRYLSPDNGYGNIAEVEFYEGQTTYSLTVNNDGHGTTSPAGAVSVNSGAATPITATSATGYLFSNWTVTSGTATIANVLSATTTVTLTSGNATIQANFTSAAYYLTVSNDGHGRTTPSGAVTVNYGLATSISAYPANGYQFSNWTVTSGIATIANPSAADAAVTLTNGNATVQANFRAVYSLTMTNDGHGEALPSGTVSVSSGTPTTITANHATGYQFSGWTVTSGTATIANASLISTTVTLTSGDATVQANFTPIVYSLTITNDTHGSTTPSGIVTVNYGAATSIIATPSTGYQFSSWTVTNGAATVANASSASTTVTLTGGNATVQANFTPIVYSLTMTNDGHGATTPSGAVTVNYGAASPIAATPAGGYQFLSWTVTSGAATIANASSASTTVTLTSGNAGIRANFTALTYSLTVSNDGHGTTSPSGTVTVSAGAPTPIFATPASGYQFLSWTITSGTATITNPSSSGATVTLSSGNASIMANFSSGLPGLPNSRQISISGTLYDQNGNPVGASTPQTVEMAVCLYSQATGGDTLYREQFLIVKSQGVVVDNGLFVVRLGTGMTINDLQSVVSANANLWAEITVLGAQPDVLLPRTPLTASPYAVSNTATTLDKTLHGQGSPITQAIAAPVGSYYVNDADGTTWVRINNGWRMMD